MPNVIELSLKNPDGSMQIFEALPDETARGAAIVIQEAYGVNEYIQNVAVDLARNGYHSIAPHLFHRSGRDFVVPYGEMQKAIEMIMTLTDDGILTDVDVTLDHLRSAGWEDRSIGIVGFCIGGRITFLTCARRSLGAGVGFYGGAIVGGWPPMFPPLIHEAATLQAPWLGLFGDEDSSIPVEQVEQLRDALKAAPVETEIVRYANAGHGFHSTPRPSFVPDAAADAWNRTLDWFARHIPT